MSPSNSSTSYSTNKWVVTIAADGKLTWEGDNGTATAYLSDGNNTWHLYSAYHSSMIYQYWKQTYTAPPTVDPTVTAPTPATNSTYDGNAKQLITTAKKAKLQKEIVAARRAAAASDELEPPRAALAEAKLGGDATNVAAKASALSDATEAVLYRDNPGIPEKLKRLQEVGRLLEYDSRREKQFRATHPDRTRAVAPPEPPAAPAQPAGAPAEPAAERPAAPDAPAPAEDAEAADGAAPADAEP